MGKLITIDYEEYLELEKYKKVFDKLKRCFKEGTRDMMADSWTCVMEGQTELFFLIGQESNITDINRYSRILIKK